MAGGCECGNEHLGSIKCGGDFLSSGGHSRFSGRPLLHGVNT